MLPIVIDCETCPVHGARCGECMVTAIAALGPLPARTLDGGPPEGELGEDRTHELALDADDHLVVDRFVRAGLLSPGGAWEVRVVAEDDDRRRVG